MKKNNKTTIPFNLIPIMTVSILSVIECALFISLILLEESELWVDALLMFGCLVAIYTTVKVSIIDYSITFDSMGFTIIERNRINSHNQIKSYKWQEIKELYFTGRYDKFGKPHMTIVYKNGESDKVDCNRIIDKRKKFINLAKQYSGRDGIIREYGRKRKPFEKDW